MAEDLLYFQQINTGFDQVRGIAVAQAVPENEARYSMQSDLFLSRRP